MRADGDDERSRFPVHCPAKGGKPPFGCATSGCPFLGYSAVRKYLLCIHPEAVFDNDAPLPKLTTPEVWEQESFMRETRWKP